MEKKVCVFLSDGFEEIEGLTVVDLLRRAGIFVTTVSITGKLQIRGSHDICVQADKLFEEMDYEEQYMVVLPGGMPGTIHLEEHEGVKNVLEKYYEEKKYIAAICAAPSIFGKMGFLKERKATSYPSKEAELFGAEVAVSYTHLTVLCAFLRLMRLESDRHRLRLVMLFRILRTTLTLNSMTMI